ncbi:MAG TPA: flagellar export chaperone FlgN [Acidimicrobiales bacterium]|nr:flagellar export chaperone FlgN [Acidimicrobiales bacterium]
MTELSNLLWRERQLLDLLQFKLEEECLLLECERDRWLAHAGREVELVLDEISRVEMARALELADVAPQFGLGSQPTLSDLAEAAPSPWGALFTDHRAALRLASQEVVETAKRSRALLERGRHDTVRALRALAEEELAG